MSERWLRWYDGTVRDGKMRIVAELAGVPVCTVLGAWASLLEDAATSTPRGTATRGLGYHAMYLQITESELCKIWNALERIGTVGTVKERESEIYIVNWHKRQFETDTKDPTAHARKEKWKQTHKVIGTARNGTERHGTPETETETEEEKKEMRANARRTRGSRLPLNWTPDEAAVSYAQKLRVDVSEESERFRDYWHARAGPGGVKLDWTAAWRTWCRNALKFNGTTGNGQNQKPPNRFRAALDKLRDSIEADGSQEMRPNAPRLISSG